MDNEKTLKNIPLTCPCNLKLPLIKIDHTYLCSSSECLHSDPANAFQCNGSIPILISETRTDTVCSTKVDNTYIDRPFEKFTYLKKIIVGESKVTKLNASLFLDELFKLSDNPKLLIIGGAARGSGTEVIWDNKNIDIHSVDIYASNNVDVICDGHYLPLNDCSYDGVWIQAVLEHVCEPLKVVEEIFRVLKKDGVVYAETPFMQQVHEGAYDFTRFTALGHRYLFKKFSLIEYGGIKGPEMVFAWSVRYLVWSLTRSRKIGRIFGIFIGILMRPLKIFVSKKSMYDASSGVFFMGKKNPNLKLTHKDLVSLYRGQY